MASRAMTGPTWPAPRTAIRAGSVVVLIGACPYVVRLATAEVSGLHPVYIPAFGRGDEFPGRAESAIGYRGKGGIMNSNQPSHADQRDGHALSVERVIDAPPEVIF